MAELDDHVVPRDDLVGQSGEATFAGVAARRAPANRCVVDWDVEIVSDVLPPSCSVAIVGAGISHCGVTSQPYGSGVDGHDVIFIPHIDVCGRRLVSPSLFPQYVPVQMARRIAKQVTW